MTNPDSPSGESTTETADKSVDNSYSWSADRNVSEPAAGEASSSYSWTMDGPPNGDASGDASGGDGDYSWSRDGGAQDGRGADAADRGGGDQSTDPARSEGVEGQGGEFGGGGASGSWENTPASGPPEPENASATDAPLSGSSVPETPAPEAPANESADDAPVPESSVPEAPANESAADAPVPESSVPETPAPESPPSGEPAITEPGINEPADAPMTAPDAPQTVPSSYEAPVTDAPASGESTDAPMTAPDAPQTVPSSYEAPATEAPRATEAPESGKATDATTPGKTNNYTFTYNHEIGTGKWDSTVPHVPSNKSGRDNSGVTIGPGYDMGNRTSSTIKSDLIKAGVDEKVAEEFSTSSGLKGESAREWVNGHPDLKITENQQKELYHSQIPAYEQRAQEYVDNRFGEGTWESLNSEQKEMLFDHTYNVGNLAEFPKYTDGVVKGDWDKVLQEYERTGADKRNQDFYNEFLSTKVE